VAYFVIIRPTNCVITSIAILVGAWVGRGLQFSPPLMLAAIIGCLVCAFGNVVNDLQDIEIDKINNPKRPLASGQLDKKNAKIFALFLFIISSLFSISLGVLPFLLVVGVLILLFLYALYFKKIIFGNFVVALIAGLSFIFGGLVTENPWAIIPFLFSFFIHWPREVIKDIIDIKGDKSVGVVSLPIALGVAKSSNISALCLAILCIILPLPFVFKVLSLRYILVVLILAYPLVIYAIFRLLKNPDKAGLKTLSHLLKISMAIGIIAMIL